MRRNYRVLRDRDDSMDDKHMDDKSTSCFFFVDVLYCTHERTSSISKGARRRVRSGEEKDGGHGIGNKDNRVAAFFLLMWCCRSGGVCSTVFGSVLLCSGGLAHTRNGELVGGVDKTSINRLVLDFEGRP